MKPHIFRSDVSRSRRRRQPPNVANLAKAALEGDHLSEAMLYR